MISSRFFYCKFFDGIYNLFISHLSYLREGQARVLFIFFLFYGKWGKTFFLCFFKLLWRTVCYENDVIGRLLLFRYSLVLSNNWTNNYATAIQSISLLLIQIELFILISFLFLCVFENCDATISRKKLIYSNKEWNNGCLDIFFNWHSI